MLHHPRQHHDNRDCCRCAQGAPPGRQTTGGGIFQHETVGAGGREEVRGDRDGTGDGGTRVYVGALPPAPELMVTERDNVDHDPGGEGGEVPDRLHPGGGLQSLLECVCLRPQEKLRPLYGSGLPLQRAPEESLQLPRAEQATPPPTIDRPNKGGQNIHVPTEGRPKGSGTGRKKKRVDLEGHLETSQ